MTLKIPKHLKDNEFLLAMQKHISVNQSVQNLVMQAVRKEEAKKIYKVAVPKEIQELPPQIQLKVLPVLSRYIPGLRTALPALQNIIPMIFDESMKMQGRSLNNAVELLKLLKGDQCQKKTALQQLLECKLYGKSMISSNINSKKKYTKKEMDDIAFRVYNEINSGSDTDTDTDSDEDKGIELSDISMNNTDHEEQSKINYIETLTPKLKFIEENKYKIGNKMSKKSSEILSKTIQIVHKILDKIKNNEKVSLNQYQLLNNIVNHKNPLLEMAKSKMIVSENIETEHFKNKINKLLEKLNTIFKKNEIIELLNQGYDDDFVNDLLFMKNLTKEYTFELSKQIKEEDELVEKIAENNKEFDTEIYINTLYLLELKDRKAEISKLKQISNTNLTKEWKFKDYIDRIDLALKSAYMRDKYRTRNYIVDRIFNGADDKIENFDNMLLNIIENKNKDLKTLLKLIDPIVNEYDEKIKTKLSEKPKDINALTELYDQAFKKIQSKLKEIKDEESDFEKLVTYITDTYYDIDVTLDEAKSFENFFKNLSKEEKKDFINKNKITMKTPLNVIAGFFRKEIKKENEKKDEKIIEQNKPAPKPETIRDRLIQLQNKSFIDKYDEIIKTLNDDNLDSLNKELTELLDKNKGKKISQFINDFFNLTNKYQKEQKEDDDEELEDDIDKEQILFTKIYAIILDSDKLVDWEKLKPTKQNEFLANINDKTSEDDIKKSFEIFIKKAEKEEEELELKKDLIKEKKKKKKVKKIVKKKKVKKRKSNDQPQKKVKRKKEETFNLRDLSGSKLIKPNQIKNLIKKITFKRGKDLIYDNPDNIISDFNGNEIFKKPKTSYFQLLKNNKPARQIFQIDNKFLRIPVVGDRASVFNSKRVEFVPVVVSKVGDLSNNFTIEVQLLEPTKTSFTQNEMTNKYYGPWKLKERNTSYKFIPAFRVTDVGTLDRFVYENNNNTALVFSQFMLIPNFVESVTNLSIDSKMIDLDSKKKSFTQMYNKYCKNLLVCANGNDNKEDEFGDGIFDENEDQIKDSEKRTLKKIDQLDLDALIELSEVEDLSKKFREELNKVIDVKRKRKNDLDKESRSKRKRIKLEDRFDSKQTSFLYNEDEDANSEVMNKTYKDGEIVTDRNGNKFTYRSSITKNVKPNQKRMFSKASVIEKNLLKVPFVNEYISLVNVDDDNKNVTISSSKINRLITKDETLRLTPYYVTDVSSRFTLKVEDERFKGKKAYRIKMIEMTPHRVNIKDGYLYTGPWRVYDVLNKNESISSITTTYLLIENIGYVLLDEEGKINDDVVEGVTVGTNAYYREPVLDYGGDDEDAEDVEEESFEEIIKEDEEEEKLRKLEKKEILDTDLFDESLIENKKDADVTKNRLQTEFNKKKAILSVLKSKLQPLNKKKKETGELSPNEIKSYQKLLELINQTNLDLEVVTTQLKNIKKIKSDISSIETLIEMEKSLKEQSKKLTSQIAKKIKEFQKTGDQKIQTEIKKINDELYEVEDQLTDVLEEINTLKDGKYDPALDSDVDEEDVDDVDDVFDEEIVDEQDDIQDIVEDTNEPTIGVWSDSEAEEKIEEIENDIEVDDEYNYSQKSEQEEEDVDDEDSLEIDETLPENELKKIFRTQTLRDLEGFDASSFNDKVKRALKEVITDKYIETGQVKSMDTLDEESTKRLSDVLDKRVTVYKTMNQKKLKTILDLADKLEKIYDNLDEIRTTGNVFIREISILKANFKRFGKLSKKNTKRLIELDEIIKQFKKDDKDETENANELRKRILEYFK